MNDKQIIAKAKREAKKACKNVSEILDIKVIGNTTGLVQVTMQSTCEAGEVMVWSFGFDYEKGNEDSFTEYEILKYPELIEPAKFTFNKI